MEQKKIYDGNPSQLVNLGLIVAWSLVGIIIVLITFAFDVKVWALLALIPLFKIAARILKTANTRTIVSLTNIVRETGIFSINTDEILLRRVTDIRIKEPFFLRVFGLSNIIITTTDVSDRVFVIKGVKNGRFVWQQLREAVYAERVNVSEQEIRKV